MSGGDQLPAPSAPAKQQQQPRAAAEPQTIYYPLPQSYEQPSVQVHHQQTNNMQNSWASQFEPDVRSSVLVVIACIIAQVVPIETIVARAVPAVQNFAHSHVVLKGLLAGLIFFLASKYV
jgi:hypothetical protein